MTDLKCPKCIAPMRVIERNGVTIERCTECGGIFLDRGELERLSQAEHAYIRSAAKSREWDDDDDDDDAYYRELRRQSGGGERGYGQQHPPKKKRRGFLDDLFDFG
ncbi:MAG: hypothetical protein DCC58_17660 [Chloroflexi bacterium]|nr:MAG: hypothetical protein DCC58_17660 [Chloroflexota bacterium]